MEFSKSVGAKEIDAILRRAAMRMQQQTIHIQELQSGAERSRAQVELRQTHAMCDRLRASRAALSSRGR